MRILDTHNGKPIQLKALAEDIRTRVRPNDVVYVKDFEVTRIEHADGTVETFPEERV